MSATRRLKNSSIFFKPWIGERYTTKGVYGKRVLVLGESHYFTKPDKPYEDATIEFIRDQWDGPEPGVDPAFYTKIVKAFLGIPPYTEVSREQKENFWQSVSFWNYIQHGGLKEPRQVPTDEMWATGRNAFHNILRELKPQCCIVLGYRLWINLPCDGKSGPVVDDGHWKESWYYSLPDAARVLAYPIYHPSCPRFSPLEWHKFIRRVIMMS